MSHMYSGRPAGTTSTAQASVAIRPIERAVIRGYLRWFTSQPHRTDLEDPVPTDAIVLLKEDHKEIRGLFRKIQQSGQDASTRQARLSTESSKR